MIMRSIYFVSIASIFLSFLRVEASQDVKPFFFIDFLDDSFLPDTENGEGSPSLGSHISGKPLKITEDKIKKNMNHDKKVTKSTSSLKMLNNEPSDFQKVPNVGDLLMKMENDSSFNQTDNEFLFIEDFFSVFNDSQLEQNESEAEKVRYTVPTAVTDISAESPDFSAVVPLHKMYLRAINGLVQYVLNALFSFTENATSRMCEVSSIEYNEPPDRKIMKRDLKKPEDNIAANTNTSNGEIVTVKIPSTISKIVAASESSQGPSEKYVTTIITTNVNNHSNESEQKSEPEISDGGNDSPKLVIDELDATKVHDVNLDVSNESKEHNLTTEDKQITHKATDILKTAPTSSRREMEEVTHNSLVKRKLNVVKNHLRSEHEKTANKEMLADYNPVSFVNNQEGEDDDLEDFHLHRKARGSLNKIRADEEAKTSTELFAMTLMIVVVIALVLGGALLVYSLRKPLVNVPSSSAPQNPAGPSIA